MFLRIKRENTSSQKEAGFSFDTPGMQMGFERYQRMIKARLDLLLYTHLHKTQLILQGKLLPLRRYDS